MFEVENTVACENCGHEVVEDDIVILDNDVEWCEECIDEHSHECSQCEAHLPEAYFTDTSLGLVCESCLMEDFRRCDHCGDWTHVEHAVCDERYFLCEYCFQHCYVSCHECGCIMHENYAIYHSDERYYCEGCAPEERSNAIRDYNDNPETLFFSGPAEEVSVGTKFLGIELEVQYPDYDWSEAVETAAVLQEQHKELFCKYDSSITTDDAVGFEIVTHPCTVDYHLFAMDWEGITKLLRSRNFVSHNAEGTGCGMHIHVSRDFFGLMPDVQDGNLAKLLYLFEKFWPQMLKLSRRTQAQAERWADRYCSEEEHPDQVGPEELLYRGKTRGKYNAINLSKRHTIEFRLWRGTLKLNTIRATIQLVDALTDLVVEKDVQELQAMTWDELRSILAARGQELATYLNERGL